MDTSTSPTPGEPPASTASSPDLVGETFGDFRILRLLGQGGMGQVYLAEQISLKRKVAIKVLREDIAANPTALERFKAESKTVARLSHANVVQVYTVGEHEGRHYMVLEYVEGKSLRRLPAAQGPLDVPLVLSIMRQVASALHRASELGIVHRDIKPENILLTRKGEAKVADFGLSRCLAVGPARRSHASGTTVGTPLYMSPEQVEGKAVDQPQRHLLVRRHLLPDARPASTPFAGSNAFEIALKHVRDEPAAAGDDPPRPSAGALRRRPQDDGEDAPRPLPVRPRPAQGHCPRARIPRPDDRRRPGRRRRGDDAGGGRCMPARRARSSPVPFWRRRKVRRWMPALGVLVGLGFLAVLSRSWRSPGIDGPPTRRRRRPPPAFPPRRPALPAAPPALPSHRRPRRPHRRRRPPLRSRRLPPPDRRPRRHAAAAPPGAGPRGNAQEGWWSSTPGDFAEPGRRRRLHRPRRPLPRPKQVLRGRGAVRAHGPARSPSAYHFVGRLGLAVTDALKKDDRDSHAKFAELFDSKDRDNRCRSSTATW